MSLLEGLADAGLLGGDPTHHRRYLVLSRLPGGGSRGLCLVLWIGAVRASFSCSEVLAWHGHSLWGLALMGRAWGLVAQLVRAHA